MTDTSKYNKQCPAHTHFCWGHRHLMKEDDYICTLDYKRLPTGFKQILWDIKSGKKPLRGNLSIIVDWLLDHPLKSDIECKS